METGRERGVQGRIQSGKQESQNAWDWQIWERKKCAAPARAGDVAWTTGRRSWFEEGNAYGEGAESKGRRRCGVGRGSGLVITGQHLQVTGSPHLCSLMFSHPLLNWIWSKENLGDIGISSGTSCINPHVPACWYPAEHANLGTASPLQPVGSHCRHCCRGGGGGLEATGRGDQASGGERLDVTADGGTD